MKQHVSLPQFPACWSKTGVSWVGDINSSSPSISPSCASCPGSCFSRSIPRGPPNTCTSSGLCYRRGIICMCVCLQSYMYMYLMCISNEIRKIKRSSNMPHLTCDWASLSIRLDSRKVMLPVFLNLLPFIPPWSHLLLALANHLEFFYSHLLFDHMYITL